MSDFLPPLSSAENQVWTATFSDSKYIKMWDDDSAAVMYDALSGDTHFLDPLALEVLRLLSLATHSFAELSDSLICDGAPQALDGEQDSVEESLASITAIQVDEALKRLRDCGLADRRDA